MPQPINMRDEVKDTITGFKGIVVGKTEYLNGCVQYLVSGPAKDGKSGESIWVDDTQLDITKPHWKTTSETVRRGGPSPHPAPSIGR